MAIGNLHRMTPEEQKKAIEEVTGVKEVEEKAPEKPEEVAVKPEETKPERKKK